MSVVTGPREGGAEPTGQRLGRTGIFLCLQARITLTHSTTHSFIHTHSFIYAHSFIHTHTHLHTQSFTHSFPTTPAVHVFSVLVTVPAQVPGDQEEKARHPEVLSDKRTSHKLGQCVSPEVGPAGHSREEMKLDDPSRVGRRTGDSQGKVLAIGQKDLPSNALT